jgi:hypothetical protein
MPALCWRKAALLLMPAVAAKAGEVVTAVVVEGVTAEAVEGVEVAVPVAAVQQPSRAVEVAEVAEVQQPARAVEVARLSNAAVAVTVLSSSGAAAGLLSFEEDLTSAAVRTYACVQALLSGSGGAATAGVTVIADRASACTLEEVVVGVIDTTGAGA